MALIASKHEIEGGSGARIKRPADVDYAAALHTALYSLYRGKSAVSSECGSTGRSRLKSLLQYQHEEYLQASDLAASDAASTLGAPEAVAQIASGPDAKPTSTSSDNEPRGLSASYPSATAASELQQQQGTSGDGSGANVQASAGPTVTPFAGQCGNSTGSLPPDGIEMHMAAPPTAAPGVCFAQSTEHGPTWQAAGAAGSALPMGLFSRFEQELLKLHVQDGWWQLALPRQTTSSAHAKGCHAPTRKPGAPRLAAPLGSHSETTVGLRISLTKKARGVVSSKDGANLQSCKELSEVTATTQHGTCAAGTPPPLLLKSAAHSESKRPSEDSLAYCALVEVEQGASPSRWRSISPVTLHGISPASWVHGISPGKVGVDSCPGPQLGRVLQPGPAAPAPVGEGQEVPLKTTHGPVSRAPSARVGAERRVRSCDGTASASDPSRTSGGAALVAPRPPVVLNGAKAGLAGGLTRRGKQKTSRCQHTSALSIRDLRTTSADAAFLTAAAELGRREGSVAAGTLTSERAPAGGTAPVGVAAEPAACTLSPMLPRQSANLPPLPVDTTPPVSELPPSRHRQPPHLSPAPDAIQPLFSVKLPPLSYASQSTSVSHAATNHPGAAAACNTAAAVVAAAAAATPGTKRDRRGAVASALPSSSGGGPGSFGGSSNRPAGTAAAAAAPTTMAAIVSREIGRSMVKVVASSVLRQFGFGAYKREPRGLSSVVASLRDLESRHREYGIADLDPNSPEAIAATRGLKKNAVEAPKIARPFT